MKVYKGRDRGEEIEEIPEHLKAEAEERHEKMMDAAAEGDDGIPARGDAGDLDRIFAGLGAGGDEDRLLLESPGTAAFSRSARRM